MKATSPQPAPPLISPPINAVLALPKTLPFTDRDRIRNPFSVTIDMAYLAIDAALKSAVLSCAAYTCVYIIQSRSCGDKYFFNILVDLEILYFSNPLCGCMNALVYGRLLGPNSIKWHKVDTNASDIWGPYRVTTL
jgi:hypothetical protein